MRPGRSDAGWPSTTPRPRSTTSRISHPGAEVDLAREHIRVAATLDVNEVEARLVVAAECLVDALEVDALHAV